MRQSTDSSVSHRPLRTRLGKRSGNSIPPIIMIIEEPM
jgi:hypothetical protein